MYRNVILALAVLFAFPLSAVHAQWGTLTGQFLYDGKAPERAPVKITKDQAFCGKHELLEETLVVNPENGGVQNVVVYLYLSRRQKAPTPHPDYAKTANAEVRIDNLNCHYVPHVATLRTTQTLIVGNKDAIGHNTKVDTIKNVPINPIIPAGSEIKQKFPNEERLPVLVSCSIHPWMNARLVIKDSPYMAVTDADGKFTIANLPEGKWTFQLWHESSGYVTSGKIDGKTQKWSKGRMSVTIGSGTNDLGAIKLSPSLFK